MKDLIRAAPNTRVTRKKSNFSTRVLHVEDATVKEMQVKVVVVCCCCTIREFSVMYVPPRGIGLERYTKLVESRPMVYSQSHNYYTTLTYPHLTQAIQTDYCHIYHVYLDFLRYAGAM